jgi:hypothetical protein
MRVIIACKVLEIELNEVRGGDPDVEIIYLDQALHRTPSKMPELIQEQIDKAADCLGPIILGYGLCSNGVVGVTAGAKSLVIPKAHDCIALLMGSCTAYNEYFARRPGTYYLSRGWLAERKDPLGITEEEYTKRVGRETAIWAMTEELKHYSHITLIQAGKLDESLVRRARQNANFFGKQYDEIPGSQEYLRKILLGPYSEEDFLFIPPGTKITQELWFPK